ncbi:MAG: DNA gyrase inhibitor YacG [Pelomonas sp.]|nr:DNA gyrase inhibitor YacG [Roseateles sp.]
MDSEVKPRIVRCPQCGGDSVYAPSNRWRPFCSERCGQVDLGAWASEGYAVAATPPTEGDEAPEH